MDTQWLIQAARRIIPDPHLHRKTTDYGDFLLTIGEKLQLGPQDRDYVAKTVADIVDAWASSQNPFLLLYFKYKNDISEVRQYCAKAYGDTPPTTYAVKITEMERAAYQIEIALRNRLGIDPAVADAQFAEAVYDVARSMGIYQTECDQYV